MKRATFLVAAAAFGALSLPAVAQAAPEVPEGCYLIGLPPSQYVFCPGGPADPDAPPPQYSICTPIEPIGELPRKTCQRYDRATDLPVGEPQIFVYPPEDGGLTPPPEPTVAPRTSRPIPTVTPDDQVADQADVDAQDGPVPIPEADLTGTDAGLIPEPVATTTGAAPTASGPTPARPTNVAGADPDEHASFGDWFPPALAGVAFLVLVGALVWKPREKRRHRA